jgi:hypothetical protein
VTAYALTKQFIFKKLLTKFPGLYEEMISESFSTYIREFRKECGKKRDLTIQKLNDHKHYSRIEGSIAEPSRKRLKNPTVPGVGPQSARGVNPLERD